MVFCVCVWVWRDCWHADSIPLELSFISVLSNLYCQHHLDSSLYASVDKYVVKPHVNLGEARFGPNSYVLTYIQNIDFYGLNSGLDRKFKHSRAIIYIQK